MDEQGINVSVLRILDLAPLHIEQIADSLGNTKRVVVLEEVCSGSGISAELVCNLQGLGRKIFVKDLGPEFVTHGSLKDLHCHCGLDARSLADFALEVVRDEN